MANNLSFYRGDSASIQCTVTNGTGGTYNLTDNTARFTVRETEDSGTLIYKTSADDITFTNATGGIMTVSIGSGETSAMSGRYVYDIEVAKSGNVYTVVKDRFEITEDVTR